MNLSGTVGDGEARLEWDIPRSGTTSQDYIIQYKESSSNSWITINDGISTRTSITITGFTNDVSYDFKVAAKKLDNYRLRYSNPITLIPQASDPIATPPTELTLYPKHESMILEWKKPIDSNQTDYII